MSGRVTRYWPHAGNLIQLRPPRSPSTKSVQGCGCGRRPRTRSANGRVLRPSRAEWRGKNDHRGNLRGFDGARFRRSRSPWPAVEFERRAAPPTPGDSITGYATLRETYGVRNGPLVSKFFPARGGSLRGDRAGATRRKKKIARGRY